MQLDVVKRPAADARVRPASAAGGFTPLAAGGGGESSSRDKRSERL